MYKDGLQKKDPAAKIGLLSIMVSANDDSNLFFSFAAASKHLKRLAKTCDDCRVLIEWMDQKEHEIEYGLYKDPFRYDISKLAKYYLNQATKGDKNPYQVNVAEIQRLIDGYQLDDGGTV